MVLKWFERLQILTGLLLLVGLMTLMELLSR